MAKATKKSRSSERDRFTVVLEGIQSDFQVFGERLEMIDEKFETRFDGVDKRFDGVDKRFDGVDKRFDGIDKELEFIKTELGIIRHELKAKVGRDEFRLLETRVAHLETQMKQR